MTIEEAAKLLGKPPQSVRLWLQSGHCPFGDAWKGTGHGFQYHICERRLEIYLNGLDLLEQQKRICTDYQSEQIQSRKD